MMFSFSPRSYRADGVVVKTLVVKQTRLKARISDSTLPVGGGVVNPS
jgi:hypothetical protein